MLLLKTQRGMEYVVASLIREKFGDEGVEIEIRPNGFLGIVIVSGVEKEDVEDIPEIETILPVLLTCKADLDEIVSCADRIASAMEECETFAVRTKRRGKHDFTSVDVNIKLGDKIRELTGCDVDLNFPDKAIYVEIIGNRTFVSVIDGDEERKKYTPEKLDSRKLLSKISLVQMPYLEDLKAAYELGERIGRAAQAFEVKELIISPFNYVNAYEIQKFIEGVRRGQETRFRIQKKAYARDVRKVPVLLQDIYQTARDKRRKRNLLVITDPVGRQIADVREELARRMYYADEVVVFMGSRTGVPKGIFRLADFVVDLAPYITFATEHAIPATVTALITIYEEFMHGDDS